MAGTIFGQPTGKWQLGTDVRGHEAALGPKFIGESPIYSYPGGSVQVPQRAALGTSPLAWMLVGVAAYLLMRKKG